jgi:hypothetical protein
MRIRDLRARRLQSRHVLVPVALLGAGVLGYVVHDIGWYALPLAIGYVVCLLPLVPHVRR